MIGNPVPVANRRNGVERRRNGFDIVGMFAAAVVVVVVGAAVVLMTGAVEVVGAPVVVVMATADGLVVKIVPLFGFLVIPVGRGRLVQCVVRRRR